MTLAGLDCLTFVDPKLESNRVGVSAYQNMWGEGAAMRMREEQAGMEAAPARSGFLRLWSSAGGRGRQVILVEVKVIQGAGTLVTGRQFLQDYDCSDPQGHAGTVGVWERRLENLPQHLEELECIIPVQVKMQMIEKVLARGGCDHKRLATALMRSFA